MKTGKVKVLALSHRNLNQVFRAGDKVTERDVENFDELVKLGKIEPSTATKKEAEKAKDDSKQAAEKDQKAKEAEVKKEAEKAKEENKKVK